MAVIVYCVILSLLTALGIWEYARHRRALSRIPIRIHVNGTRGKSSVTRLIAAGLRAAGVRTCAKTTGTLPRLILPDGSEVPVFRPTGANVIEQVRIVAAVSEMEAQALVVECMAIQPVLQWLCEARLIKATLAVITNARADHLEVMGPTELDVALALAGVIPRSGKLITAEQRHLEVLKSVALDRNATCEAVTAQDVARISDAELAGFAFVEHRENVALALRVCQELGVRRDTALAGMQQCQPDPGAMTSHELNYFGRHIHFVNGFAANDPESSGRIWTMAQAMHPTVERRILVFNCRSDRADRSLQLGEACPSWPAADHYVVMGTGTWILARAARRQGLDVMKMVIAEHRPATEVFETLIELAGPRTLIMGLGNIADQGMELTRLFRNRAMIPGVA